MSNNRWKIFCFCLLTANMLVKVPSAHAQFDGIVDRILDEVLPEQVVPRPGNPQQPPPIQYRDIPNESGQNNQGGFQPDNSWGPFVPERRPQTAPPQGSRTRNYPIYENTQPSRQINVEPPILRAVGNGQPIQIFYRKTQSGTCDFTLIGGSREFSRTMSPGQRQPLKGSNTIWRVRYNGRDGTTTYRLRGGSNYVFLRDSQGFLQLYKDEGIEEPEPPVLDR